MRAKVLGLVLVVAMATACGARVTKTQIESAGGASTARPATASQPSADTDPGGTDAVGAADQSDGTAPTPGATVTTAPGPTTPAASSGPTDNGGATDVGLTGTQMRLGSITTLSGPVPGLFAGAVYGVQAWQAYQNSLGGIHGRKIAIDARDDQFDTGQNRGQTREALARDFALVGSFSLYDDAAVGEIEKAGVTDVHVPLANAAQQSPNNFSVNPVKRGTPTGPWELLKSKFPGSIGAVAGIYGDVPAAKESFLNLKYAMESLGYKFVYERGYQPTETDFTADVVRMKSAGVKFFMTGGDVKTAARLAKAMQAQNFKPDAFVAFGTAYDASFSKLAGSAGEGVLNVSTQAMYMGEDAAYNPEVRLFLTWLNKVKPGYQPDLFAAYGWGSGRLFAKAAEDAGPRLTRAGLLAAMRKIDQWNGYGMFPAAGPASKRPASCFIVEQVRGGRFVRWNSPPPGFLCNGHFLVRP